MADKLPVKSAALLESMCGSSNSFYEQFRPGTQKFLDGNSSISDPFVNLAKEMGDDLTKFISYAAQVTGTGASARSRVFTGSCGVTSELLDAFTSKKGAVPSDLPYLPIAEIVDEMSTTTAARWYCRVSTGGHSFLVEFMNGEYFVYQSFFGAVSLDVCLQAYYKQGKGLYTSKADFFRLLETALLDVP